MRIGRLGFAVVIALCGVGCSEEKNNPEPPADETSQQRLDAAEVDPTVDEFEGLAEANEPEVRCTQDPAVLCRGPIQVSVQNVTLTKDQYRFGAGTPGWVARVTFSVENRDDIPVRFNVLGREPANLSLENGIGLEFDNLRDVSGVTPCEHGAERCLRDQSGDFVTLQKGDSPATFDIIYDSRIDPSLEPSASRVDSGNVNLQLILISADGISEKVSPSFTNVAVFNSL